MKVKLLFPTEKMSTSIEGIESVQDLISYCARVSNPSNQMNKETSEKLLNYLIRHKHWSPFEMVGLLFEIETTRDIARQILRHRSFTFQEFSQRYADPNDLEETFVLREARLQDTKNRQNSIDLPNSGSVGDLADAEILRKEWEYRQKIVIDTAKETYQWAIENGIAKEQARAVLPEGNTVSKLYVNGTVRSWIHYVELRSANGTQKEHMEIARAIGSAISKVFPLMDQIVSKS